MLIFYYIIVWAGNYAKQNYYKDVKHDFFCSEETIS